MNVWFEIINHLKKLNAAESDEITVLLWINSELSIGKQSFTLAGAQSDQIIMIHLARRD